MGEVSIRSLLVQAGGRLNSEKRFCVAVAAPKVLRRASCAVFASRSSLPERSGRIRGGAAVDILSVRSGAFLLSLSIFHFLISIFKVGLSLVPFLISIF